MSNNHAAQEFETDSENAQIILNLKAWYENKLKEVGMLAATGDKPISIAPAENPSDVVIISDPVELKGFKKGLLVASQMMGNFPLEIDAVEEITEQNN